MDKPKVVSVVACLCIVVCFFLPWLDFYGDNSGWDGLKLAAKDIWQHHSFHLIDVIIFFVFIPIGALLATLAMYKGGNILSLLAIIIADLIAIYCLHFLSGFEGYRDIRFGFYLTIIGLVVLTFIITRQYLYDRWKHREI